MAMLNNQRVNITKYDEWILKQQRWHWSHQFLTMVIDSFLTMVVDQFQAAGQPQQFLQVANKGLICTTATANNELDLGGAKPHMELVTMLQGGLV